MTPAYAQVVLNSFGVGGLPGRSIILSRLKQAFTKLLFNDNRIDAAENAYLDELKTALGLTDSEVSSVRSRIAQPEFLRRSEFLLLEDPVAPETRQAIAREARNLRIPIADEQTLLREPARKALAATLQQVFVQRRAPDDEANKIGKFLDDYGVTFEGDEQEQVLLGRGTCRCSTKEFCPTRRSI